MPCDTSSCYTWHIAALILTLTGCLVFILWVVSRCWPCELKLRLVDKARVTIVPTGHKGSFAVAYQVCDLDTNHGQYLYFRDCKGALKEEGTRTQLMFWLQAQGDQPFRKKGNPLLTLRNVQAEILHGLSHGNFAMWLMISNWTCMEMSDEHSLKLAQRGRCWR